MADEIVFRIAAAFGAGVLLGLERQFHRQPAGLKTVILVCVGSALLMLLSLMMAGDFTDGPLPFTPGDPGRIAAQVVSGIGFLGAGAILRQGLNVKGLTTAATMWFAAAVGLACGAGKFFPAAVSLLVALCTLILMEKIEEIDDKHFVITWKDFLTPSDEAKTLLLAQDTKSASVPYHIFKDFADQAIELTNSLEECPVTNPSRNAMYFNKNWNGEASDKYGQIYTAFRAYEVDGTYPCTGPYKLKDYNETVMTLVKNEDYYFADTIGFDKIEVTMNPTESVTLQMLSSGQIDYMDGTPMKSKLETVLAQNGSMVHYKILDQGTIGLLFNLEKEVWEDDKVREAFQYIFDRDMIKNVANPYAETSFYSMSGMADYEAEKYLNPDDFNKMTLYEYNQNTASALLQDAGWEKKSDGWYDSNNEKVSLTLGYIGGDPHIAIATTVQAQLQDFGIELTLKSTESPTSLLANARVTDSEYDFMIYFTALNPWGSHPGGAMKHLWAQMDAAMMHIPTNQDTGRYQLILDKANGEGTINAFDTYEIIYTLEGNELREATADLIVGFSKKNYGINFYNNVTGSFFNLDTVGNLPLVDMFSENRNITKIFYYDDAEFNSLANLNLAYTQATSYSRGIIKERD